MVPDDIRSEIMDLLEESMLDHEDEGFSNRNSIMFHYYEASDPLRYLEEINQRIGKVDLVIGAFVGEQKG